MSEACAQWKATLRGATRVAHGREMAAAGLARSTAEQSCRATQLKNPSLHLVLTVRRLGGGLRRSSFEELDGGGRLLLEFVEALLRLLVLRLQRLEELVVRGLRVLHGLLELLELCVAL